MPKNVIIILIVILLVGGGAFWYFQNQQSGKQQQNVITSIKDALSQSISLECTYKDAQGKTSKTYIKNGAIRSDYTGQTPEETGSVIVKDKVMYVWDAQNQGFMMKLPDETGTPVQQKVTEGVRNISNKDDLLAELEQYKDACKPAIVSDSLFTPPAEVKFTDYSQMMEQTKQFTTPPQQ